METAFFWPPNLEVTPQYFGVTWWSDLAPGTGSGLLESGPSLCLLMPESLKLATACGVNGLGMADQGSVTPMGVELHPKGLDWEVKWAVMTGGEGGMGRETWNFSVGREGHPMSPGGAWVRGAPRAAACTPLPSGSLSLHPGPEVSRSPWGSLNSWCKSLASKTLGPPFAYYWLLDYLAGSRFGHHNFCCLGEVGIGGGLDHPVQ